jgi:plasmid stability protein
MATEHAERMHQQYSDSMVSITIRDVPQETRNELAARAAHNGQSLQEYVRSALMTIASRPDHGAVIARMRRQAETYGARVSSDEILAALHAAREERE